MLSKLISQVEKFYWTHYFKKFCTVSGQGLTVTGPVKISGIGEISCGDNLLIRANRFDPVKIHVGANAKLSMGSKVFLNNRVHISCTEKIEIGTHVDIADECLIIDNDFHGVGANNPKKAPIIINDDVWLATRVIVLKGVTIGKGSVIGAGSVVAKSIPPNSFAAGVPAKVIRSI
jgi:acetyltransferase-like isoleucine patch superfamily enzyme